MTTRPQNFVEANRILQQYYGNARTSYNLETMRQIMAYLGNPQNSLRVIHVAGTSGKTSTAYYAAALLRAAGLSTGLTVSPHVDEVNERLQLNLRPLAEADFCAALGEFISVLADSHTSPSYFEFMIAFAYWYFAREAVDVAVIEVGLGGLLDGTNVVDRPDKLCIITDIGFDHTEILGNTITAITAQKAGIIQPENATFMYAQDPQINQVVKTRCAERHAELHVVSPEADTATADLPLFQQRNFHLARAACDFWLRRANRPELKVAQLSEAARVYIPGRMEIIAYGQKVVILDGAHNGQKLQTLLASIQARFPRQALAAMIGFVAGDEQRLRGGLDQISRAAEQLIVTSFSAALDAPKQSVAAPIVTEYLRTQGYQKIHIEPDPARAFVSLLLCPQPLLLVTGSFYLLNHIRPIIRSTLKLPGLKSLGDSPQ